MFLVSSYYGYSTAASSSSTGAMIWTIIAAVVAVIGGIALYFTVFSKGNDGKFKGFMGWLYNFFRFNKLMLEDVIKVIYLIAAIYITLGSFSLIATSFLAFLLMLVVGNIVARIVFEFAILTVQICKNTNEINEKLKKPEETKKTKEK